MVHHSIRQLNSPSSISDSILKLCRWPGVIGHHLRSAGCNRWSINIIKVGNLFWSCPQNSIQYRLHRKVRKHGNLSSDLIRPPSGVCEAHLNLMTPNFLCVWRGHTWDFLKKVKMSYLVQSYYIGFLGNTGHFNLSCVFLSLSSTFSHKSNIQLSQT